MKKIYLSMLSVLLIITLFLFLGCSKKQHDTSPEYNSKTDYNMAYDESGSSTHFIETEDGYYYTTSQNFLYYIDKTTMQSIAVCHRPECNHTIEEAGSCGAHLGFFSPNEIFYNNGKIYGFSHHEEDDELGFTDVYFCELSDDGTISKKLWKMKWEGGLPGDYQLGIFHRGVLYFYTSSTEGDFTLYAYDIQTKKCKCIYMNEKIGGMHLKAIGNYLYWWVPGAVENVLFTPLMRYEISTGKVERMDNLQKCFAGGEYVFFQGWDEVEACALLSYSKRDGSEFQKTDIFLKARLHADDRYIYGCERETGTIYVYDLDTMKEITSLDFSRLYEQHRTDVLLPGYGDKIFLMNAQRQNIFYAYKSAIGTDDFQWYEVEKVN